MTVVRYLGYVVFFIAAFVLSVFLTFPWNAVKDRGTDAVSRLSGMTITAEDVKPSWLNGVTVSGVNVTPAGAKEPIAIDEVTLRVKLFSLLVGKKGGSVALPIAKGNVEIDGSGDEETISGRIRTENIELGLLPGLADAVGLPLTGTVDIDSDLVVGQKDPKLTNGTIGLKVKGLKIEKGGKIAGFPVPELAIGDAEWKIPVEAGKATLKNLRVAGESLELILDGSIAILNPPARSTLNLTVSFKPTDKLLTSEPLLGALLNNIQRAKGSDGFYTYAVAGGVKSPRFTPRKK